MGYVKRKTTTKASTALTQEEFAAVKKLVINWDQTGINVVSSSQWTQAEKGATKVEIAVARDKRQITVTVAGTLSGKFLLFLILYEGKTERCHPLTQFPGGFDIWHTTNHWSNGDTTFAL